ncbi:uncharacterized protein LOC131595055 [Vicia villosa]|uniref:uncharacterized protein LOC131595055 n=1 Tax=Vicia villosa TaxID=3911 RepID=UPI00273BD709|nr:uncharacterized protein LOC131595055 [Vicia villosa]
MGRNVNGLEGIDLTAMRAGPQLNSAQHNLLITPVTEQEIVAALNGIGNDKSSGVDGFGVYFFKKAWQVIKIDVTKAIQEFFVDDKIYKAANCSLVTLIPKHNGAKEIKDYRPISCCSTLYKIISKILANRLSKVLGFIVGDNQAAFVKGQNIHNHILLTYELIKGYERKHISSRCFMQMDIKKAYDTVDWFALESIFNQENDNFNYHPKCDKLKITNLCFADDLLLFSRDIDTETKRAILQATKFQEGRMPFKYLGVPVTGKKLATHHYQPLIDKILDKIKHWTARLLTYAGRLQLINSVMFSIWNYWPNRFPFPKNVIQKIEKICRIFLWTGGYEGSRKLPITCKNVCRPKCYGGMNIIDIELWNKSNLIRLLWNLSGKTDSLWIRWIQAYYVRNKNLMEIGTRSNDTWIKKAVMMQRYEAIKMQEWQEIK